MKTLLEQMTLHEKIGQLMQLSPFFFLADLEKEAAGPIRELHLDEEKIYSAGSILGIGNAAEMIAVQSKYLERSRLKIPLLFMADVIHGYKTIFPVPLALAASWNPDTARRCARVSATEAATSGIHMTFSPMADLVRDPRWGRCVESFGESPLLSGRFAAAMVEGYQNGDLKRSDSVAACVKHFAGYGAAEGGRDYNTVDLSRQSLQSAYLEGYRQAVKAGCRGVMTAFNPIEGIPCTVNRYLLRDVLRTQWGFDGLTISDYDSLAETIAHGVAEDPSQAALMGLEAGLDIEMASSCYINHLEEHIRSGNLPLKLLDEAVLRVLTLKQDLGLFDNPNKGADALRESTTVQHPDHLRAAHEVAAECAVLLTNDGTLPLNPAVSVAILGPYALAVKTNGPWSWHGYHDENPSLAEVLTARGISPVFAKIAGCPEEYSDHDIDRIRKADVVLLALGEPENWSGEAHSRTDIGLPGRQAEFVPFVRSLGKKAIVLLQNGRPLVLEEILDASAILETWFLGSRASEAIADLLYGVTNPSGRLPMSFPRSVGQIPVYHDALPTGRPNQNENHPGEYVTKYLDAPNSPRFAFGHGLSYSRFEVRNLSLSASKIRKDDVLAVEVDIINHGPLAGDTVIQLYLGDPVARISRPVRQLVTFRKIHVAVNETLRVRFELDIHDLSYRLADGTLVCDPGRINLWVGDSPDRLLSSAFVLE